MPDGPGEARRVDVVGAGLCALALAGVVFGLIEQPRFGWASPAVVGSLSGGLIAFAGFVGYERRASHPMLRLDLFGRRNFAIANVQTLTIYAGLSVLFFFLFIFLQEVAGYSAVRAGLTTIPSTLTMFFLSRRLGALSDRHGPRLFLAAGPLLAAAGILLFLRTGLETSFVSDLLPALLVFSLGLAVIVAPLTATVLADADETDAGIASAINNAIARVAGLIGISAIGALVAAMLTGDTLGPNRASVDAFHTAIVVCAALVAAGGVIAAFGIQNPRRVVRAEHCAGGQLVGAPREAAGRAA